MPVALAAKRREDRLTLTRTQCEKIADFGVHPTPLLEVTHTDAPTQPRINLRYGSVVVREAEIVHPTSDVMCEPVERVVHRDAPAASGQSPDVMFEVGEGLSHKPVATPFQSLSAGPGCLKG